MLRLRTLGWIALEVDGSPLEGGPRRRALALLALVAAAGRRGVNRDGVISILWPDSPLPEARHALSQTLYALRQGLNGREPIVQGPELRLDPKVIGSDLDDFAAAIAARDWAAAARLYRGPFLAGFVLPDVPGFERWIEDERRTRAADAQTVLEAAAAEAASTGRTTDATGYWRRLVELDPLASRLALGLMEALARGGDRGGAVAHAKAHGDLVRRELEIEPDPAIAAAVDRMRTDQGARGGRSWVPAPVTLARRDPSPVPVEPPAAPSANRPTTRRIAIGVTLLIVAVVTAVAVLRRPGSGTSPANKTPVLAVGDLRDLTAPDSTSIGNVLGEVLTTSLSRLTRLDIIATSRMLELMPRGGIPARAGRLEAARKAGADEILEGELAEAEGGALRLELRRIDVVTGVVRRGYLATARDRWAVVDSITNAIAADLALAAPLEPIEPRSAIVLRLYEDGLRALYQYDTYAAARSFAAAVAEDSTFAMAAYYGWWSAALVGDPSSDRMRRLAQQLADRAPTHDRLLIRTHVGGNQSEPGSVAAAESLAVGYPRDPEALGRSAQVFAMSGAPVERTVGLLDRAIAIDSATRGGRTGPCRLCESFATLFLAYDRVDSIPAVIATLNRWAALLPEDPQPPAAAAAYYLRLGRDDLARKAGARYTQLNRRPVDSIASLLTRSIYQDDIAGMERGCSVMFDLPIGDAWGRNRWLCTIALRVMGRFRAAAALVGEGRAPFGTVRRADATIDPLLMAILDFETQRPLLAADFFLRTARALADSSGATANGSRQVAWNFALAATAAMAAQDTVLATRLTDSIATYGARSAYARDPRLHHFVRGLILAWSRRHTEALDQHRAAVSSWPLGYTRINFELAGSALALDLPREAVYPLQSALRGGLEGPQLYLNRTEIHERLATAFDRLGQIDSAAFHFGRVARLWKNADPILQPRYQAAHDWLARHRRPVP